jgi:arabinan endo-1,5-alpha-L-arabinosidase
MSYRYSVRVPKAHLAAGFALSLGALVFTTRADAQTSGANGTHDPSRMMESDGKFYVYSTGGGSKSSTDGLVWTNGPALFPNGIPSSGTSVVSNNEGVWAPDVIYLNNQYYIYYALANAQNACAVGLVTTPTLDPTSPSYKLTDRGVVVSNTGSATYCAIDPCPQQDASGNLWLTFGSGYSKSSSDNTIYVMRLDNTTGLATGQDAPGTPLEPGHIEASYVYYHAGYYYLFWNSGGCCSGASSTYEIHVARSQTINGSYTGGRIFIQSAGSVHGPGQIGIYDQCSADRFTYHYYPDTGGSVLGENELTWGSDGWPVAGAESTTPLKACGVPGSLDGGTGSPDASAGDAGDGLDASGDAPESPEDGGTGDDAMPGTPGSSGGGDTGTTGAADDSGTGAQKEGGATKPPVGDTGNGSSSSGGCNVSGPQGRDGLAGVGLLVGLSLWMARRKRARV